MVKRATITDYRLTMTQCIFWLVIIELEMVGVL